MDGLLCVQWELRYQGATINRGTIPTYADPPATSLVSSYLLGNIQDPDTSKGCTTKTTNMVGCFGEPSQIQIQCTSFQLVIWKYGHWPKLCRIHCQIVPQLPWVSIHLSQHNSFLLRLFNCLLYHFLPQIMGLHGGRLNDVMSLTSFTPSAQVKITFIVFMNPSLHSYFLEDLLQGKMGVSLPSEGLKPQTAKSSF